MPSSTSTSSKKSGETRRWLKASGLGWTPQHPLCRPCPLGVMYGITQGPSVQLNGPWESFCCPCPALVSSLGEPTGAGLAELVISGQGLFQWTSSLGKLEAVNRCRPCLPRGSLDSGWKYDSFPRNCLLLPPQLNMQSSTWRSVVSFSSGDFFKTLFLPLFNVFT